MTLFEEDRTPEIETLDESGIDDDGALADWRIHNDRSFTDEIGRSHEIYNEMTSILNQM